jgi:hypothetical protein
MKNETTMWVKFCVNINNCNVAPKSEKNHYRTRREVSLTGDCLFPVLGSIPSPVTPPPRAAQEQELLLNEVGPSPGRQPG